MPFQDFLTRSSVGGVIRWPRAIGKAAGQTAEKGLQAFYSGEGFQAINDPLPAGWQPLWLSAEADETEYRVWFFGFHIVHRSHFLHRVRVEFAPGVAWEPTGQRFAPFRRIDPPERQIAARGDGGFIDMGEFRIEAQLIVSLAFEEFLVGMRDRATSAAP